MSDHSAPEIEYHENAPDMLTCDKVTASRYLLKPQKHYRRAVSSVLGIPSACTGSPVLTSQIRMTSNTRWEEQASGSRPGLTPVRSPIPKRSCIAFANISAYRRVEIPVRADAIPWAPNDMPQALAKPIIRHPYWQVAFRLSDFLPMLSKVRFLDLVGI